MQLSSLTRCPAYGLGYSLPMVKGMSETPATFNVKLIKRSIRLAGHPTSLSLEEEFWDVLEAAAEAKSLPLAHLLNRLDQDRDGPLASAARVYALRLLIEEVEHLRGGA